MACCTPESFGLTPEQLQVVVIAPVGPQDVVGIVTALEGAPLPSGDIASRLGGYDDIAEMEQQERRGRTPRSSRCCSAARTTLHNNYQDFQTFLDDGGKIGLQHDPLLYGAYLLNPFLVARRHGADARREPGRGRGHQGVRRVCRRSTRRARSSSSVRSCAPGTAASGRSRCAPASTRSTRVCTRRRSCPTSILTLNWADAVSTAHNLDAHLSPIEAKSREGFVFRIDLQVQIHVPDTRAPKVISMVGTMQNLVNEVLQAAVGNHFRNTLQSLEAVRFIETRARGAGERVRGDHRVPRRVRRRDARRLHPGRRSSPTSS